MANERFIELHFIDGRPDGMVTATADLMWPGHLLAVPRTQISDALNRKEAEHTGVYLLLDDDVDRPTVYIGEGDSIQTRIRAHIRDKDWWTRTVFITAIDNALNKAHVRYLEACLIKRAQENKNNNVDNNGWKIPSLSKNEQSRLDAFLEYLLMVLPTLQIKCFETRKPQQPKQEPDDVPIFELRIPRHNLEATARLENGKFVVQAGSKARKAWSGTLGHAYNRRFDELVTNHDLVDRGELNEFSKDYPFDSPSAAAAIVTGRNANGQIEWKLKGSDRTYKDWEEEELASEDTVPIFELRIPKHDLEATARLENDKFVVQAGSKARKGWSGGSGHAYSRLFDELVTNRTLVGAGRLNKFSKDYSFDSPSAAAAIVTGRNANGKVEWKLKGAKQTYGDWKEERHANEDTHDG